MGDCRVEAGRNTIGPPDTPGSPTAVGLKRSKDQMPRRRATHKPTRRLPLRRAGVGVTCGTGDGKLDAHGAASSESTDERGKLPSPLTGPTRAPMPVL